MKKLYSTSENKRRNTRHAKNSLKRKLASKEKVKAKRRSTSGGEVNTDKTFKSKRTNQWNVVKLTAYAPNDLRLMDNTDGCLSFFRDLRSEDYLSIRKNVKFVIMSLKNVTHIDYGTISVLTAINDEFKYKRILLKTILPDDRGCRQFMIDSGYLNNLVNEGGRPFPKSEKSDLIFFEKGSGVLSDKDNRKISLLVKNVVNHLTGEAKYSLSVKTIILEICGNSIEWSGTESKQWLLGIKYEADRVLFTVTDVGRGILDTLYRKFSQKVFEPFKSSDSILKGAFDKKYGSTSQEVNRNKGLPAVKTRYIQGAIKNLKVLTNNVVLHFDDDSLSKTFDKSSPRFKGTFYQWEMAKDCLNHLTN